MFQNPVLYNPYTYPNYTRKRQKIVLTLNGSLKMKYEISEQLSALYDYLYEQLVQANIHKDAEIVRQLLPFFSELKDSFVQVGKKGY